MKQDLRLIEDYLPIKAISAEASREKSVRKGHISTLHLWWARRPLVACRAAVYGALVPASRFQPKNGPEEKRESLGRANAAKFVERLCKYPGSPQVIAEAQRHILEAHADRLTAELETARNGEKPAWVEEFKFSGEKVTVNDIVAGRAPRPRVLDMFAGGGSIPLEALRLGCEAHALELNPVAHIIELCTLVYPQKYGKPDPNARGMTGPKNERGETTWGGLAEEVRYWGKWVLEKVKAEIGDLYPLIPDPEYKGERSAVQATMWQTGEKEDVPPGYLVPVAYLWTRTVRCKNPSCGATVPLVKQTWLCKKKGRYVALRIVAPEGRSNVRFEVVEHSRESDFDFDPSSFSRGGNATCPFCGTVADVRYVKCEGWEGRMGRQPMAIVATRPRSDGKIYLSPDDVTDGLRDEETATERVVQLCRGTGLTVPEEPIANLPKDSSANTLGITVRPYGIRTFGDLYSPRQLLSLLVFVDAVSQVIPPSSEIPRSEERVIALRTCLAVVVDRLADFNSTGCTWNYTGGRGVLHAMASQRITMTWDFAETNPFNRAGASWVSGIDSVPCAYEELAGSGLPAKVMRGSADEPNLRPESLDAIITDPPYYDNVPYSDISDYFYVWLKRTVGNLYPSHFTTEETPKKKEAIADSTRHGGDPERAKVAYEAMMIEAFSQANRALKPGGQMTVVYAHKTTLGWATMVEALRKAGFVVSEAWPLDTERSGRLRAMESAALASSIFLVARKRNDAGVGAYERDVQPQLEEVVRGRVETLWQIGLSGADLVIAAVGAGLSAFTRFASIEYANGEEVPAESFLAEVEGVVLETLLAKIFGVAKSGVAAVDGPSRFYTLSRYTYGTAMIPAGEAIVFSYGQLVELDGQGGLSCGRNPLLEKIKDKYRLRDFTERGPDEKIGLPSEDGTQASLIDVLHRALWLMEYQPTALAEFLSLSLAGRAERLRLVAQALEGAGLSGKSEAETAKLISTTTKEQAALKKLMQNWRALVEQDLFRG